MVEARTGPLIYVVAGFAAGGEAGGLVVHGPRLLELRKMTTGTRGVQPDVDTRRGAGVTRIAG